MTNRNNITNLSKAILVILAVILASLVIFPASAEEIKRLYFEDIGVSLEMPDSVQYITMDMIKARSFPNNSGVSYEEYQEYFEQNNIYVLCYKKNENGSILVQIYEAPPELKDISIDRSSDDAHLMKIAVEKLFVKLLKKVGFIIWDYDEYEGENYTGFRFHNECYDGTSYYSTSYILVENGRLVRLVANTPDGAEEEFPEDREQILREIFDSIQVHPLPETEV